MFEYNSFKICRFILLGNINHSVIIISCEADDEISLILILNLILYFNIVIRFKKSYE